MIDYVKPARLDTTPATPATRIDYVHPRRSRTFVARPGDGPIVLRAGDVVILGRATQTR